MAGDHVCEPGGAAFAAHGGFCVGLVLAALGGLLCCTIIGAVVGIPLGLVGLGMMFKCFW